MATAEATANPQDRNMRRRPFTLWMRRLANLKHSSEPRAGNGGSTKRNNGNSASKSKKSIAGKNKHAQGAASLDASSMQDGAGQPPFYAPYSGRSGSVSAYELRKETEDPTVDEEQDPPAISGRSTAVTSSTEPGTTHSDATRSTNAVSLGAGTNTTVGGEPSSKGGAGSTFSSPAPSERSLTTTLTTIQSTGPTNLLTGGTGHGPTSGSTAAASHGHGSNAGAHQNTQFSLQFPSSPPVSSMQSHLAPHGAGGNPTTYTAATANNLLTDNASILTLASSSKRHRRHSLDTDASVRALAPSSLWGGSRESLPLSVLSSNVGDLNYPPTPGLQHGRPSVGGITNAERASVYSASGIAPALSSDRNSFYAGKANAAAEGGSIKSGLPGHGRNDSVSGSIGGASLSVASPRETSFAASAMGPPGRGSRRSSGWAEVSEEMDGGAAPERQESRKTSLHGITQGLES